MGKVRHLGAALFGVLLFAGGCGSPLSPGVKIISEPTGATVQVSDEVFGKTPVLISRKRLLNLSLNTVISDLFQTPDSLTITLTKEGYLPKQVILAQRDGVLYVSLVKK
ncbi:MAG: hypothetical protein O2807_07075 [bacterium]|nr:hypothetical protein [bacterium]